MTCWYQVPKTGIDGFIDVGNSWRLPGVKWRRGENLSIV